MLCVLTFLCENEVIHNFVTSGSVGVTTGVLYMYFYFLTCLLFCGWLGMWEWWGRMKGENYVMLTFQAGLHLVLYSFVCGGDDIKLKDVPYIRKKDEGAFLGTQRKREEDTYTVRWKVYLCVCWACTYTASLIPHLGLVLWYIDAVCGNDEGKWNYACHNNTITPAWPPSSSVAHGNNDNNNF